MNKVIFSLHAKNRVIEYGLSLKKLTNNFKYARSVIPPLSTKIINQVFHTSSFKRGGFKKISYKWFDGVLYTISKTTGKNIIMTITPKVKEKITFG